MEFRQQVSKELEGLSKEQQGKFALRTALRALPFLGSDGHFKFWGIEIRQKHLYNVFNVLDLVFADDAAVADAAYDAADAAYTFADVAYAAVFAAAAAADAEAESDTAHAAAAYASNAAKRKNIDLEAIILDDIQKIKRNDKHEISTKIYGKVWNNFQQALINEGCEYWAKLYKGIFDNNFEMDMEELELRINVPKSIRQQGAAAVGKYMEELLKGRQRLNEARILILGEKGSGKTCLARKLKNPKALMTTPKESTPGVDTSLWKLEKENINVRIWDFAGHTVTHAVHQFFLSERCLYIIVYDGRSEARNRLEYWLDHMMNFGGDSEAIILVNERDQHKVEIPINSLKERYRIAGLYFFNIDKDKEELAHFTEDVTGYIKNNPSWEKQQIPASYFDVKEKLEDLFSNKEKQQGTELITKETFLEIAKKKHVDDPENLLKDLHALGVSLWYKDMEKYNTLVLNPEWISEGVYKIINWVSNAKSYEIKLAQFEEVFEEERKRFPADKDEFLFDLIKHYELAYETVKGKKLIIPHLLNKDQPAVLPQFDPATSLKMKYEADRPLPSNTISRFIVRHNEQIKKEN
jgi:GTPase SAR1 family protein